MLEYHEAKMLCKRRVKIGICGTPTTLPNATLLINWHITSGLNGIYTVPYWPIYQLFLDDVPCCAPLLSHLCFAYNIKFQRTFVVTAS